MVSNIRVDGFVREASGRRSVMLDAVVAGEHVRMAVPLDDAEALAWDMLHAVQYARKEVA